MAALWIATPAQAASDRRITLTVEQAVDSTQASQLAFLVKERYRQSGLFYLAENSATGGFHIKLNVVAVGDVGALAYSAILTANGGAGQPEYYLTNWEGWCGVSRLQDCSQSIFQASATFTEQFSDSMAKSLAK